MRGFTREHPVGSYFALAFLISWGGVLWAAGGLGHVPATPEEAETLLPLAVLAMLLGPAVSAIVVTASVDGWRGVTRLLSRMRSWRAEGRWYAVALLVGPICVVLPLVVLSTVSSAFVPGVITSDDRVSLVLIAVAYGLGAGFFEELGWTGVAVPRLRQRFTLLRTGLVVGVVWGVWHFFTNLWGSGGPSGELLTGLFIPAQVFAITVLPPYRVMMVWVHDHTGSLPMAMIMHMSLTASWLTVMPLGISGTPFLVWYLLVAALLSIGAVAVVRRERGGGRDIASHPEKAPT